MKDYNKYARLHELFVLWNEKQERAYELVFIPDINRFYIRLCSDKSITMSGNLDSITQQLEEQTKPTLETLTKWIDDNCEEWERGKEQYLAHIYNGKLYFEGWDKTFYVGAKYLSEEKKEECKRLFGHVTFEV